MNPIHLQPTAQLAERVLLPGDPGRALVLAQSLLEKPRMFNHNRGLWGYTGRAGDGEPLTVQSTGMGGPSAAIVISELAALGARRLVRVGTCGAFACDLQLGELVVVGESLAQDGASRALGAGERAAADAALLGALARASGGAPRTVVSTDLFYEVDHSRQQAWKAGGAAAVEMECATLFTLARMHGLRAAALLVVSDLLAEPPVRIEAEDLRRAERRMGEVALLALAPPVR